MRRIKLTQGQFALIDDADYDLLSQWKWQAQKTKYSYLAKRIIYNHERQIYIAMPSQILGTVGQNVVIDHIDRDTLNNQRNNLRIATRSQNSANRVATGESKYLGVHKSTRCNSWRAAISKKEKRYYLGSFKNEIDAAIAYNNAAKIIHGEFANLNKI